MLDIEETGYRDAACLSVCREAGKLGASVEMGKLKLTLHTGVEK